MEFLCTRLPVFVTFTYQVYGSFLKIKQILTTVKTIIRLLSVIVCSCVLTGCPDEPLHKMYVTMPFGSEFTTSFTKSTLPAGSYTKIQGPVCQMVQVGEGRDEEIGRFELYLKCCWSEATGEHGSTEGYLSDIDGDVLNVICRQKENAIVFTPDYPYDHDLLCFEIEFDGGTGKFAEATGSVIVSCHAIDATSPTIVHQWEGSLKMFAGFLP
jgi:hypothetical protein